MTGGVLLACLGGVMVILLGIVVFYSVRLAKASKRADGTVDRLRRLAVDQGVMGDKVGALAHGAKGAIHSAPQAILGPAASGAAGRDPGSDVVLREVRLGLAHLSEAPIYVAREQSGAVTMQVGSKPPAPLSYVLDPRMRQALQTVVGHATVKFGRAWSILAWDDSQGSLTLRRLS